jgi:hypothetical protein
MNSVNTRVVIVRGNGEWFEGFDDLESLVIKNPVIEKSQDFLRYNR